MWCTFASTPAVPDHLYKIILWSCHIFRMDEPIFQSLIIAGCTFWEGSQRVCIHWVSYKEFCFPKECLSDILSLWIYYHNYYNTKQILKSEKLPSILKLVMNADGEIPRISWDGYQVVSEYKMCFPTKTQHAQVAKLSSEFFHVCFVITNS